MLEVCLGMATVAEVCRKPSHLARDRPYKDCKGKGYGGKSGGKGKDGKGKSHGGKFGEDKGKDGNGKGGKLGGGKSGKVGKRGFHPLDEAESGWAEGSCFPGVGLAGRVHCRSQALQPR